MLAMPDVVESLLRARPSLSECAKALRAAGEADRKALLAGLKHDSGWVRAASAVALCSTSDHSIVPALLEAARDVDPDVAAAAAWSTARIGTGPARRGLEELVNDSRSEVVAEVLYQADWVPKTGSLAAAYCIARRDWSRCVEVGPDAVEPLAQTLRNPRPWMRKGAALALGALGDRRAAEALELAFRDPSPIVLKAAAVARSRIAQRLGEDEHATSGESSRLGTRNRQASKEAPVLVLGAQRSGTTLVRLLLTSHPSIAIPPEGDFLVELAGEFAESYLDTSDWHRFVDGFTGIAKCGEWGIDRGLLASRIERVQPTTYADLAAIPYRLYGEITFGGKPRWGDKNPYYVFHIDELMNRYPNARVVVVTRDARDVVASVLPLHFGPSTAAAAAVEWLFAARAADAAGASWGSAVRQVRYEDVVADPIRAARELCDHVREPFDAGMLDFHRLNQDAGLVPRHRRGWHEGTLRPTYVSAVGRHLRELAPQQLLVVELLAAGALAKAGCGGVFLDAHPWEARDSLCSGPCFRCGFGERTTAGRARQ